MSSTRIYMEAQYHRGRRELRMSASTGFGQDTHRVLLGDVAPEDVNARLGEFEGAYKGCTVVGQHGEVEVPA